MVKVQIKKVCDMYEQTEKPKENKSRAVANSVTQKKSNAKQGFGFVDNRPVAIAQRKLHERASNNSPNQRLHRFDQGNTIQQEPKNDVENVTKKTSLENVTSKITSDSTPQAKKEAASAWLAINLKSPETPGQLFSLLQETKNKFFLDDVLVDFTKEGEPQIGLIASPPYWILNKFLGNTISDWGIWGVYGTYSSIRDAIRTTPTSASATNLMYGHLTGRGFGTYMLADPLAALGPPGIEPSVTNPTWRALLLRRQNLGGASSYYVRGHLLNDKTHGTGSDWKNLTPLTQRTNNHSKVGHEKKVEKEVKNRVAAGEVLCYQVIPKYGRLFELPRYITTALDYFNDSDMAALAAAESHVPQGLYCKLWHYDANGKRNLILNEFIPQMEVSKVTSDYWVQTSTAGVQNLANPSLFWEGIQAVFLVGLAASLGYGKVAELSSILTNYAESVGLTVGEVIMQHQWSIPAVMITIGAYSAYKSSGRNPWPEDRSRS